jgi:sulfur-oxidizing protein SoxY
MSSAGMREGVGAWRTRREALRSAAGAGTLGLLGGSFASRAGWAEAAMAAATELTASRSPEASDRIRLTVPRAFKRGDAVPLTVEVDGPMTGADYVEHIHLLADANPLPEIASFHFTLRSGRARVVTRIRLAKAQDVVAVAEMGNGAVLMAKVPVDVETDGCT